MSALDVDLPEVHARALDVARGFVAGIGDADGETRLLGMLGRDDVR
jgi:hypothetical protein